MWLTRDLEARWNAITTLPVRVVRGVRQSGKSSLLAKLGDNSRLHLTFDDLRLRTMAQQDPALFFDANPGPLILDEVQYVPNLFPEIKLRVDRARRECHRNRAKLWHRKLDHRRLAWSARAESVNS